MYQTRVLEHLPFISANFAKLGVHPIAWHFPLFRPNPLVVLKIYLTLMRCVSKSGQSNALFKQTSCRPMWLIFAPYRDGSRGQYSQLLPNYARARGANIHTVTSLMGTNQRLTPPTHFASSICGLSVPFVKNCKIVKSRRVPWPGYKNKESTRSLERVQVTIEARTHIWRKREILSLLLQTTVQVKGSV